MRMSDRELTQLISIAKHYLDVAGSVDVPSQDLDCTVSASSLLWPVDRLPYALSPLAEFSAHLASCAVRLATIHEILIGGTKNAWAIAYPNGAELTDDNLKLAISEAFEILFRDNVAHAEYPPEIGKTGENRSKFRRAALDPLTFKELLDHLKRRYEILAKQMQGP
jgi:hypothetical protein